MERTVKKYRRRRPNPFLLFCNENRRRLIKENPGLAIGNISQMLGTLWSQLEIHKKQVFIKKAEELNDKYLKEFSDYKLNTKRLRERHQKKHTISSYKSSNQMIICRPTTVLKIPLFSDKLPEIQTNNQLIRPEVEPISEEKRNFFRHLGLCQRNSTEYYNIVAKQALNARKYHIFTFMQKIGIHKRTDYTTNNGEDEQNKDNRPRGRPRKY